MGWGGGRDGDRFAMKEQDRCAGNALKGRAAREKSKSKGKDTGHLISRRNFRHKKKISVQVLTPRL